MRILFTTNPLFGHWLPLVPLVRAAQRVGHDVVVAAGPDLIPDIGLRGIASWPIGPDLASIQARLSGRPRAADGAEMPQIVADVVAMFADPAVIRARDLLERTSRWQPDVVVREIYELGGAYVPAGLHVLHGLGTHFPNFVDLATLALNHVARTLGPPAASASLPSTPYIDPFPKVLQPSDDRPFADVIGIRPEAGEVPPGEALPPRIAALPHERTVYLTLGTFFNAIEEFALPIAALAELPVNVILTCGIGVDPAAFGVVPNNVVVEQFVPQALLLDRCSAVVCHGGAGTVIGALAHGKPVVCLPRGADQFGNATQLARSGAGMKLPPDQASVERVRDAVHRVLEDPSYTLAATAIAAEIAQLPSPAAVVSELERRHAQAVVGTQFDSDTATLT